jgi:hypothetical protein
VAVDDHFGHADDESDARERQFATERPAGRAGYKAQTPWQCFGLCRPPLDKLPDTRLLGTWYAEVGGPLALWRAWATNVSGGPFDAGHFFPEEIPEQTDPSIAIIAVQRRL